MHFKLTPLFLLVLLSCEKQFESSTCETTPDLAISYIQQSSTKGFEDYVVNERDVDSYIHYVYLSEKELGAFVSIDTSSVEDNPVYYVIQFQNGWKILSADKRGPVVLGYGENTFLGNTNPAEKMWLDALSDDILFRRIKAEEYYSNVTEDILERESYCLAFWSAINCDKSFITEKKVKTKFDDDPPLPSGHYELFSVYYTDDIYENVEHLITDPWHQWNSYNNYCPYMSGSSERCPAGCVAIAAAQILYYSHYKIDVPTLSPASGYCYGDEHNFYQCFYDYSDSTWNQMNSSSTDYAALLIGDIGLRVGMDYGSDGSSADEHDLPDCVFQPYGLSCTFLNGYNSNTVFSSLQSGWPVLFSAFRYESPISWPGHSFLIDGYTSYARTTHYVYEWVSDPPLGLAPSVSTKAEVPVMEPYEIISISSPWLVNLRFRWGYADSEDDNTYAPDGAWSYLNRTPYNILKTMIYGFSPINND